MGDIVFAILRVENIYILYLVVKHFAGHVQTI